MHASSPDLLHWLVSGGDDRIALDAVTGLNLYGYGARPRPDDLSFSSSTASTISEPAYQALQPFFDHLVDWLKSEHPAELYERQLGRIRLELSELLGLGPDQADIIMASSGTDIHLIMAQLLGGQYDRPLQCITLAASETGSGVCVAAAGRHFMSRAASGQTVAKGEELSFGDRAEHVCLNVRDAHGNVRDNAEIEQELDHLIAAADQQGRRTLLVVADVSKTGLIAPSLETVFQLKARWPNALRVMIDACQFRISPATLRAYLDHGFPVAITGSKFMGGPIFSGALLTPPRLAKLLRLRTLPHAMADYCARADWPKTWAARRGLPMRANFGLLLRWQAALVEIAALVRQPEAKLCETASLFAAAVRQRLQRDPAFEPLVFTPLDRTALLGPGDGAAAYDEIQTIFPFLLRKLGPDQNVIDAPLLSTAETFEVYKTLTEGGRAQPPVRLGQPVRVGHRDGREVSALRLCLSAPQLSAASADPGALERLVDQAMTALDATRDLAAQQNFPQMAVNG